MKELIDMYHEMQEKEILMDQVFFNTIVAGLTFNKSISEAIKIANDAFRS